MGIQVDVTKEAQSQVRELIRSQKPGTAVRVYLEAGGGGGGGCGCGSGGGGCGCGGGGHGGPRFAMAFDHERPGDQIVKVDGFSVLVDDLSAEYLDGASIDFVQGLEVTGFKISAPKLRAVPASEPSGHAEEAGGCGCGSGGCGCG